MEGIVDYSQKTEQLIGQLCHYRESGIKAIVNVVAFALQDGILMTDLFVVAQCIPKNRHVSDLGGETFQVSARKEGGCNQIWQLFPLSASTIAQAVLEVDPQNMYVWNRGPVN